MKRVLITGASGGIGSACAAAFAQAGYETILHYHRSAQQVQSLCAELNAAHFFAHATRADLTDSEQVTAMFQQTGALDVLVNNAGSALQKLLTETTEAEWDSLFSSNAKSMFLCCKQALLTMVPRHAGSIINVSSMWGLAGASCEAAYSASKAAVIGLTKALAKEVGPSGIRVNCIAPGVIDTPMNSHLDAQTIQSLREETPLCRIGRPEDVAQAILFLAGEGAGFITGQILGVDGGILL